MITIASPNGKYSVSYQCDYSSTAPFKAFTRSRTMLAVKILDPLLQTTSTVNVTFGAGGVTRTVVYYTDPAGVLEIPTRNELNRWYDSGVTSVAITITPHQLDGTLIDGNVAILLNICDGISYDDMLAPRKKDIDLGDFPSAVGHDVILPPNVMFNPNTAGQFINGVVVESNYHTVDGDAEWTAISGGVGSTVTPSGSRSNQIYCLAAADVLQLATGKNHDKIKRWEFVKTDECTDLVCIQWLSQTGAIRRHYFPVVSFINANDKEVSIVEAGNGYDVRKNAYKGVKCRLTGLTPYSCWYYQDLLLASNIHAVVNRTWPSLGDELESMETACYAEGGMETTPEGAGFFNFEFTLKLRHYDTV